MSRPRRNAGAAPAARIRRMRRLGASLMAGSFALATALTALAPAAVAQEGPTVPEGTEPVEVESTAYWAYKYTDALPPTVTREFPPGVVCLVRPELPVCQPNPASEAVEGAIGTVKENEQTPPASPVPPDTLPAAIQNGARRYESAVKFTLPPVPAGETVGSFTLVLTETQPTYHSSSPAFRQAVLAALTCARECQQEEFQKALGATPVESAVLGVEICAFTEPFEEGPSQTPPEEQPVNCLYGGSAERVAGEEGKWVVDLTYAAQAWANGEIENHGILIRPQAADNLAYGDPDPTAMAQVTFTQELVAAATAAPAPEDPPALDDSSFDDGGASGGGFDSDSGGFSADEGGFSSAPSGSSSGGFSSDPFSAPAPVTADDGGAAPEVAPDDGAAGVPATDAPLAGPATEPAAAGSTWWLWLLVPVFAVGSWMTAQSLTAEAIVPTGAISRNGAMTRLIARNQASPGSPPMTQV